MAFFCCGIFGMFVAERYGLNGLPITVCSSSLYNIPNKDAILPRFSFMQPTMLDAHNFAVEGVASMLGLYN